MSRESILSKIKKTLKDNTYKKKTIKKAEIHFNNKGDKFENFLTNLANNKTEVIRCEEGKLVEKIKEILAKLGSKKLLHSSNLPFDVNEFENIEKISYDKSVNEMSETLFNCDTSIIQAKLGVSNLGIFCTSSDEQPRLMSLLPQNCIVLLKKEDVVESMNEAYEVLSKNKRPTNIVYIAGPSRTADIELILVLGVHGPQRVYGLVY